MRRPLPPVQSSRLGPLTGSPLRVCVASSPLTKEADASSSLQTELIYGESVYEQSRSGGFVELVNAADQYLGYVHEQSVSSVDMNPTHNVRVPTTQAYRAPNIKARAVMILPMGGRVAETGPGTDAFMETEVGFVPRKHLKPIDEFESDPLTVAMMWRDLPYLWGGRTALGIDCSALVQLSFAACGVALHRDSDLQWQTAGDLVGADAQSQCKHGDLAFFPGHVGIMVDETNILHANATNMRVTIDPLVDVIEWVRNDLKPDNNQAPFTGFRRFTT